MSKKAAKPSASVSSKKQPKKAPKLQNAEELLKWYHERLEHSLKFIIKLLDSLEPILEPNEDLKISRDMAAMRLKDLPLNKGRGRK